MRSAISEERSNRGKSLTDIVRRCLHTSGPGSVVSPSDFLPFGSRTAVDQALSRLAKDGTLRRLRRGVYYVPQVNERLGIALSPTPDAITQALARSHKTQVQVAGAQAANLLGLSEQVPARIVYLTDGTASRLQVDNQTIELRHAAPRSMQTAGRISGTVIQALRHLGKTQVTPEVISRLREALSDQDKQTLRQDLLLAPGWMRPLLAAVTENTRREG
jgi:hypothetical protein